MILLIKDLFLLYFKITIQKFRKKHFKNKKKLRSNNK